MAALAGFDIYAASTTFTPPLGFGGNYLSLAVPAGLTLAGIDLTMDDLDTSDTNTVDVASPSLPEFINDSFVVHTGGTAEYRPAVAAWYRYSAASTLFVSPGAPIGFGGFSPDTAGAVSLTVYGYASVDRAVLVRQTLQLLGVVAEGETPRAEDAAITLEALADVHEMMRGKGLANRQDLAWPLLYVPLFASRPYSAMAANLLADTFGLSQQRATRLAARAVEGERELRRQTRKATTGAVVSLEPYRADTATDYGATI